MRRRAVSFAVEFRIVRFILLEHIVNGGQEHSGNGNNCFLVSPPLFQSQVTAADFWELFGSDGAQSTLNKQRLDVGPGTADFGGFFFPALSLFCGVSPAQEQRCLEVGNTDISTPISEITPMAEKAWIPGAVATMLS